MKPILKPRRMVAMTDPRFHVLNGEDSLLTMRSPHDTAPDYAPVLVIPLVKQAVIALQVKIAKDSWKRHGFGLPWTSISGPEYRSLMEDAKAALAAIGVRMPRR